MKIKIQTFKTASSTKFVSMWIPNGIKKSMLMMSYESHMSLGSIRLPYNTSAIESTRKNSLNDTFCQAQL